MGEGAEDADSAAEAWEAMEGLREALKGPSREAYHNYKWEDRRGNKTKLKNLSTLRLKNIKQYLNKKNDQNAKNWLKVINYVLSTR